MGNVGLGGLMSLSDLCVGSQGGASVRVWQLPKPAGQPGLPVRLTWTGTQTNTPSPQKHPHLLHGVTW